MGINRTQHSATGQRPYETVFGGRRPYLDGWVLENRKHKKLINEDGAMSDDEDSINFQIRFERTEAEEPIENLPFADEDQTPRMQFTNFVLPSASATTQINQEVERQDLADDQSSFEGFDSDDVNPDIDADNRRSSSTSSLIPQLNEVSRSASNSENLQTFEGSSSSQRQGIDITVLKARERLQTSRKQMATRYNRRTKAQVFQPGQIVTVKIPKIDRSTATGSRRCYAEILRAKNNRYEMRTEYGVLDRWYAARDICVVPEALARNKSIPASDRKVSLREVARQESNTGNFSSSITSKAEE